MRVLLDELLELNLGRARIPGARAGRAQATRASSDPRARFATPRDVVRRAVGGALGEQDARQLIRAARRNGFTFNTVRYRLGRLEVVSPSGVELAAR